MPVAENKERNRELVLKRLQNQKKWSYGRLGVFYKIHRTTAEEIFLRDREKYSSELQETL